MLVYPALMTGLLMLVRRRNPERDRAGVIDSLIMTLGLSLLSWVALIAPYLHDGSMGTVAKLVSIAYPLGDILLLAAAIRLAVDSGRREPAFYLLALSIVALLVTDFAYGVVTLQGAYDGQVILDVGWISFYLLWGAAALHPSMREPRAARPPTATRSSRPFRLALLTGASLIAPAVEAVHEIDKGDMDLIVIIGASAVLFGLVVARMAGLVRQQERSVARERTLTAAGAALVAATSRDEIARAALDAIESLVGSDAEALLCLVEDDALQVVAARTARDRRPGRALAPATAGALLGAAADDRARVLPLTPSAAPTCASAATTARPSCSACRVRAETRGLLVVCGEHAGARAAKGGLRSLATQVSLALESAALTEEVHRRTSEARFGSLIRASSDLITVLDSDARIVYQSPSIERVLGYTPDEVVGTSFASLLPQGEQSRLLHLLDDAAAYDGAAGTAVLDCTLRHRDGEALHFEIQHTNLLDDEHVRGIVLNSRDVSERKAFEEQLQHQAFHDPVTGLANRALFAERVRHAVARARRDHIGLAVIFIDLDDFKTINDSLGHAAGDRVLLEVGKRLGDEHPRQRHRRYGLGTTSW